MEGAPINYSRHGAGPTVVLQHGFVGGGGYFAPQVARLARFFDVICPDLPGFAGSASRRGDMSIPGLSRALVALLDHLGVERCSLLGHSLGGSVALQTALDHPQRITRLVLYATGSSGSLPRRFETVEETVARIRADGVGATARRIASTWFVAGERAPLFELCAAAAGEPDPQAAMDALTRLPSWDASDRLHELGIPVLVICGDRDRSYGLEDTIAMARGIADVRICVLPGCAHAAHLEAPEAFTDHLVTFLLEDSERLGGRAASIGPRL